MVKFVMKRLKPIIKSCPVFLVARETFYFLNYYLVRKARKGNLYARREGPCVEREINCPKLLSLVFSRTP